MVAPLGFSAFFPFDSDEFRSCDLNGNGLIARGAKDGLISSMGKCVLGFAKPVAIPFAIVGAISLCAALSYVGKSDKVRINSLSNKCFVGLAQGFTGRNLGKVYQLLFQRVIHPLVQKDFLCDHKFL
jgi:hypothetical protein